MPNGQREERERLSEQVQQELRALSFAASTSAGGITGQLSNLGLIERSLDLALFSLATGIASFNPATNEFVFGAGGQPGFVGPAPPGFPEVGIIPFPGGGEFPVRIPRGGLETRLIQWPGTAVGQAVAGATTGQFIPRSFPLDPNWTGAVDGTRPWNLADPAAQVPSGHHKPPIAGSRADPAGIFIPPEPSRADPRAGGLPDRGLAAVGAEIADRIARGTPPAIHFD